MGAVSPGPSPSQPLPVPPPSPGSIEELTRQEAIAELQRDQALLQKRLDERVAQLLPVYTQVPPRSRHETRGSYSPILMHFCECSRESRLPRSLPTCMIRRVA